MNERIIELADKAVEDISSGPWNISDEFCIKFAELLIRECVGVADDYVKDCTCDEHINCKHPQSAIGKKIREHFGILQSYKVICDRTNNP